MKRRALLSWEDGPDAALIAKALKQAFPQLEGRLSLDELGAGDGSKPSSIPFSSTLAHELKSPINAVAGYLRMIQLGEYGPSVDGCKHPVERSLARLEAMQELVENVLALSRAESGSARRVASHINVAKLSGSVADSLSAAARKKGIAVRIDCPEGLSFNSYPGDLQIILSNLISNAIKYNRSNGSVTVSFSKNNGILTVRVSDSGIGISPDELEKLAGDFARIRNAETREIPGSGLGIPIVRRIAALYDGALAIESSKGEGSVFTASMHELP